MTTPSLPVRAIFAPPGEGFIRIGPIRPIPDMLREMGQDVEAILEEAGVDLKLFDEPDHVVPYAVVGRLLSLCAERARCPHFGLLLGARRGLASLGLVGMIVREAPDVRSALRDLVTFLPLHDRGAVPALEVEADGVTLSYAAYAGHQPGGEHVSDGAAAMGFNIMRELCGPAWAPTEIYLPRAKPADTSHHTKFFKAPVRFGADRVAIAFDVRWLDRRVERSDPELRGILLRQLERLRSSADLGLKDDIRSVVRTLVVDGDCSAKRVAKLLAVSERTLNRRLAQKGASFRGVVEEARFEVAQHMLADGSVPLSEIAAGLGYSEASAFSRAFRRWSGMSPVQWRKAPFHGLGTFQPC
jgi:AraC-like DNA-binding protein